MKLLNVISTLGQNILISLYFPIKKNERGIIIMSYNLESDLKRIKGKVICVIDGKEYEFDCSNDIVKQNFDKKYVIANIEAKRDAVVLYFEKWKIPFADSNSNFVKESEAIGEVLSFF